MAKNNNKRNMKSNNNYRRQTSPSERAVQLIGAYQNQLCLGYSDETWNKATSILLEIGTMVDLSTYSRLGSLMSEAFTNPDIQNVILECDRISASLQTKRMR